MKIKPSLNRKNIFIALYLLLMLANALFIFELYGFINKYIYKSIIFENDLTAKNQIDDIDMVKFENIIKNLEKKKETAKKEIIKNIFN